MPRSARIVRTRWPSPSRKMVSASDGSPACSASLMSVMSPGTKFIRHGNIVPDRIDSNQTQWLYMNYNSKKSGRKAVGSYNAVSWLLDRNVEAGRGDKLAYTDTATELTYHALQQQPCRVANLLRRLGVRREERVAMIMLDPVDFPAVFLGAMRAGIVPVPLNALLTSDQYGYVLADCRARVLFVSEALYPTVQDIVGRMSDLDCDIVAGANAIGHKMLSDELARESESFETVATHEDETAFWL